MAFHTGAPNLADLQRAVGGYVEAVSFPLAGSEASMWVNEEGKLVADPHRNWKAECICPMAYDWIAGDVAFTGGVGPRGETLGLSGPQILELRRVDRNVHVLLIDDQKSGVVIG
jgi:hypothetical protein